MLYVVVGIVVVVVAVFVAVVIIVVVCSCCYFLVAVVVVNNDHMILQHVSYVCVLSINLMTPVLHKRLALLLRINSWTVAMGLNVIYDLA